MLPRIDPSAWVAPGAVVVGGSQVLPGVEKKSGAESISTTLREIAVESMTSKVPIHRVALERAEEIWREARRKRQERGTSVSR